MDHNPKPLLENLPASYDAIIRRARVERSRAIGQMLQDAWPFLCRLGRWLAVRVRPQGQWRSSGG